MASTQQQTSLKHAGGFTVVELMITLIIDLHRQGIWSAFAPPAAH